jgi:hypothetical protein
MTRIASNSVLSGRRKSKTMKAFDVATPAIDRRGQFCERIVGVTGDGQR